MQAPFYRLTDEKAGRMMAALRDGRTLRKFGVRAERLQAYFDAHPEYAAEAKPLIEANARAALYHKGDALRCTTHCRSGRHLLTGRNVEIDGTHGRRRCRACRMLSAAKASPMSADIATRVKAAIARGSNLTLITKGRRIPGSGRMDTSTYITSFKIIKRYRIEHPEFDRFIIENARDPLSRSHLMRCRIVPANAAFFDLREARPEIPPFEMRVGDYDWILSLISRKYDHDMRQDIAQDILEALVLRSIGREQVPNRIPDFISKHGGAVGSARFDCTLDSPLVEGGKLTGVDAVAFQRWKEGRE
jgi:hypothetical protein